MSHAESLILTLSLLSGNTSHSQTPVKPTTVKLDFFSTSLFSFSSSSSFLHNPVPPPPPRFLFLNAPLIPKMKAADQNGCDLFAEEGPGEVLIMEGLFFSSSAAPHALSLSGSLPLAPIQSAPRLTRLGAINVRGQNPRFLFSRSLSPFFYLAFYSYIAAMIFFILVSGVCVDRQMEREERERDHLFRFMYRI